MQIEKENYTTVNNILHNYTPKYSTLNAMSIAMANALGRRIDRGVNIYIDLYRMILSLFHRDKGTVKYNNSNDITACVINYCANIRSFYKKIYKLDSTIYLIYNDYMYHKGMDLFQKKFFPEYNKDSEDRMRSNKEMMDLVKYNISILSDLVKYIPKMYIIKRPVESMIIIYDLIKENNKLNPYIPNIIFTTCPISIQLPALLDNTVIFRLYKIRTIDDSGAISFNDYFTVMSKENAIASYISAISTKNEIRENIAAMCSFINSELLSFIITLIGVPKKEKNIPRLLGTKKVISSLYDTVKNNPALNCYVYNISDLYGEMKLFKSDKSCNNIDIDYLRARFNAIDLVTGYNIYLNSLPYHNDNSYIIDLNDGATLKEINESEFHNNPLSLDLLF